MRLFLYCLLACFPDCECTLTAQVYSPTVQVVNGDTTGSGTVIEHNGKKYILTCAHCVKGDGALTATIVRGGKRVSYDCSRVAVAECPDLALLRIPDGAELKAARFTGQEPAPRGGALWACGCPGGVVGSLEAAVLNNPDYRIEGKPYYLINFNGWYGSSGGGVYSKREGNYYLIGVVFRLAAGNPRSPMVAENQTAIANFLKEATK